jgi:hypothetical protein
VARAGAAGVTTTCLLQIKRKEDVELRNPEYALQEELDEPGEGHTLCAATVISEEALDPWDREMLKMLECISENPFPRGLYFPRQYANVRGGTVATLPNLHVV